MTNLQIVVMQLEQGPRDLHNIQLDFTDHYRLQQLRLLAIFIAPGQALDIYNTVGQYCQQLLIIAVYSTFHTS